MGKQLIASFKKEILLFTRTHRLLGICLVFVLFAIFDPLLIKGMKSIAGWYDELLYSVTEQSGMDLEFSMESMMDAAYGEDPVVSVGVIQAFSNISFTDLVVMLIILNLIAGGEQKKRSTIIPSRAGLKTMAYSLPKFIIYPIAAFVITVTALLVSYFVSIILFAYNDLAFIDVLISGFLVGFYISFFTVAHLFIGISTGKPTVSAVICILASMFLPSILSFMNIADKYNPFALMDFSQYNLYMTSNGGALTDYYTVENIVGTIVVTALLMVIMFFLTLFIQTARKIDNRGKNVLL